MTALTLIEALPKPLVDDFLRDRWLPIVGAGFSKNAVLPTGKKMPDWSELADSLGKELQGYEPQNAVDAISAYEETYGRSRLVERLGELLHVSTARAGVAHKALCLAPLNLIATTNFDFLIEAGYHDSRQAFQPLLTEAQLSQRPVDDPVQLLKLHGDLNHPDELVATEDDFDGFLERRPLTATFLGNLLITRTPVLLGYSFDDPDTRALWALIRDRLGTLRRRGYVLKLKSTPTEVARFDRRGITVVELPGKDHGQVFAQLFTELRELFDSKLSQLAHSSTDEVAAQLALPKNVESRLVYFSVPAHALPWYRDEVFPHLERRGYVPVTSDDVLSPGTNMAGTVRSLLSRSQYAVFEIAPSSFSGEISLAFGQLEPEQLVFVADHTSGSNYPLYDTIRGLADHQVIVRTESALTDPGPFLDRLFERIPPLPHSEVGAGNSQPTQLLELGQYTAALILAVAELERTLAELQPDTGRVWNVRRLVDAAVAQNVVSVDEQKRLSKWLQLRNYAAHGKAEVSRQDATAALADIARVVARAREPG
jgi:hypothetical protein